MTDSAAEVRFPLLGALTPGTTTHHTVTLPGTALASETWAVTAVCGARPGPVVLVGAGVHGAEYPAIEAAIRLGTLLDPETLSGTVICFPVLTLPMFRERRAFVCPVDGLNPNRTFPGKPDGTYTEQLVHGFMEEFIARADVYLDLHGGDMVEDLVPFSIARAGDGEADRRSRELAAVFGLPYLLLTRGAVEPGRGSSSYVAATARGIPSLIAEAGRCGLLEEGAVQLLTDGVQRVLNHLGMTAVSVPDVPPSVTMSQFEWVYTSAVGMFYPAVAVDETVTAGQVVGRIGDLYGGTVAEIAAPISGRIMFLTTSPPTDARGLLMAIGAA